MCRESAFSNRRPCNPLEGTQGSKRGISHKYLTRSGVIDTTLYLVNYENNGGFALLGADERVRPIYAISDEGQLNMSDTIENKGLVLFFRNIEAEMLEFPGMGQFPDSISIIRPPVDPEIPTIEYEIRRQTEPLLNYYQNRWNQQPPYNAYCPVIDDTNTVVGCMAVAIGQIMAYHQYPVSVGSDTFNWAEINSGNNNDRLAYFFRILGNPENLNMTYRLSESSSLKNNAQRTFENLGYNNPGSYLDFNEEEIIALLEQGEAGLSGGGSVYVDGRFSGEGYGHAWVIDGYLQYNKVQDNILIIPQDILFHCVWGFALGNNNGYYYWAKTETIGGFPKEYADVDRGITVEPAEEHFYNIDYLPISKP